MTYGFLKQFNSDYSSSDESTPAMELTADLADSVMNTLGKIGGSIFLSSNEDPTELAERSSQFLDNLQNFTEVLIDDLSPGSELPVFNTKSFELAGGKFTAKDISKKTFKTNLGSKLMLPILNITSTKETTLLKYEYVVFDKNPRINLGNVTIGNTQRFNFYSENERTKMEITNLNNPINFSYELRGITKAVVESLYCSFYNHTIANYSTSGMETMLRTIYEDGKVVIECSSNHLSDFDLATNPAFDSSDDSQTILSNNNAQTVTELDRAGEIDTNSSKRTINIYIYIIYIYIYI